jgi:hypothetical protein
MFIFAVIYVVMSGKNPGIYKMTKTYFDMGRRFTGPIVFTDIQCPKWEVRVDPAIKLDETLLSIVAKIGEEILESCAISNFIPGNQPKTPNVDTGSGPIIDIKPEDYNVIDEQKLINGYK